MRRRQRNRQLYHSEHQRLSKMSHLYRKKWRLQSHAMLEVQASFLLDVPWRFFNNKKKKQKIFIILFYFFSNYQKFNYDFRLEKSRQRIL